jgi:hypothetical protein
MKPRNTLLSAAALFAIGFAGLASAQSATSAIQGAGKAGDVAIIQNAGTGVTREVKVKDNGKFALRNLPTGTYNVTIRHADGSSEPTRTVTLQVGSTARVL